MGLFLPEEIVLLNWIGLTSVVFIVMYLLSIRMLNSYERKLLAKKVEAGLQQEEKKKVELKSIVIRYTFHALVVIAAALALPYFSQQIALDTGLSDSFMGTLFLAASSSLPEIAVSISATRMGAPDLAVGNLLGSNLFNVMLLSINDMFYGTGRLLKDASDINIITIFSTIIMNAIVIIGLIRHSEKKKFRFLAWDTLLIFLVYLINMIYIFIR